MDKKIRAVMSPEAKESWDELNGMVAEEIEKGITNSFNQQLFKSIKRVKELIETNKFYGDNVKKDLIPDYYREKYGVTNLFRVELVGYWRLVYTLEDAGNNIEILAIVLEFMNHDDYDKRFGYRKR
jgi:hypothetical protein